MSWQRDDKREAITEAIARRDVEEGCDPEMVAEAADRFFVQVFGDDDGLRSDPEWCWSCHLAPGHCTDHADIPDGPGWVVGTVPMKIEDAVILDEDLNRLVTTVLARAELRDDASVRAFYNVLQVAKEIQARRDAEAWAARMQARLDAARTTT